LYTIALYRRFLIKFLYTLYYRQFYIKKLIHPLFSFITQGVTPKKLALTIAFGVTFGVLPVFGLPTILSLIFALILRLNIAAIQLVNYFMYPLWIILFIPFLSAGNMLFDAPPINLSFAEIEFLIKEDFSKAVNLLGMAHLRATLVWVATAPLIGVSTYYLTLPIFTKYALKKMKTQ